MGESMLRQWGRTIIGLGEPDFNSGCAFLLRPFFWLWHRCRVRAYGLSRQPEGEDCDAGREPLTDGDTLPHISTLEKSNVEFDGGRGSIPLIFTIGHSTRGLNEFITILKSFGISEVVDIRTVPRSRHNPQFNRDALPMELEKVGMKYRHIGGLGGLRKAQGDPRNNGLRDPSFRGFADYMQSIEFEENLQELFSFTQAEAIVLMCAEALPWRCHRSLIADALMLRGAKVMHIMNQGSSSEHRIPPWA